MLLDFATDNRVEVLIFAACCGGCVCGSSGGCPGLAWFGVLTRRQKTCAAFQALTCALKAPAPTLLVPAPPSPPWNAARLLWSSESYESVQHKEVACFCDSVRNSAQCNVPRSRRRVHMAECSSGNGLLLNCMQHASLSPNTCNAHRQGLNQSVQPACPHPQNPKP